MNTAIFENIESNVRSYCRNFPTVFTKAKGSVMTAEDGNGLVEALERQGIPAVVVGKLTDNNDRVLHNDDEIRYMDKPKTDEIYKLEEN